MSHDEDEYPIEYCSREEVLSTARKETKRDLVDSESSISYVAFVPAFDDFCRCEFRLEAPHGWVLSCRMLQTNEREPDEQITDARIRNTAKSGKLISAIRLYRGKYSVSLAEAKAGLDRLLAEGS